MMMSGYLFMIYFLSFCNVIILYGVYVRNVYRKDNTYYTYTYMYSQMKRKKKS